jgi:hypothetical protein
MLRLKTEDKVGLPLGVIIRFTILDVLQGCYDPDIKLANGLQKGTPVNK